jgi:Rv0078B-related antitoxin
VQADTSPSAEALQLRVQRGKTGEQRLIMAIEMSLFARELGKEGIRREHPQWSEYQIARELIRRAFLPGLPPARLR